MWWLAVVAAKQARVYAAAQQLVFCVLTTGGGIIGYLARDRGDTTTAVIAGVIAAVSLLGLGVSLVSARKWRFKR